MTPEYGSFCLALLCALSLFGSVLHWLPVQASVKRDWAHTLPTLQWLIAGFAFILLIESFMGLDYSMVNVASHAHNGTPMLYRITASWGHHEGSMLLWVWLLTCYGAAMRYLMPKNDTPNILFVSGMSLMTLMLSLFLLLTSNPFKRLLPPPIDGQGLNPVLQDIALAIHPPLLYVGYVGFAAVGILAWSLAHHKSLSKTQWKQLQAITAYAFAFLTAGIGLGSWWAYRELGWGGFWFWDPVENVSLLPWLAATALLHGLSLAMKRGYGRSWCLILAATTLISALLGTFLVRSGMLTSVHAFAHDPERGLFILAIIVIWCVILFSRIIRHHHSDAPTAQWPLIGRESLLLMQHVLMVTAWLTIMLGIAFPLYMEWRQQSVTVGAAYYNIIFAPLAGTAALMAAIAPNLRWHTGKPTISRWHWALAIITAIAATIAYSLFTDADNLTTITSILLASYLAIQSLLIPKPERTQRSMHASMLLGHLSLAILIIGAIASVTHRTEINKLIAPNTPTQLTKDWSVTCTELKSKAVADYYSLYTDCHLTQASTGFSINLTPERRHYETQQSNSFEVAQHSNLKHDIQLVMGEVEPDTKKFAVRFYIQPFIYFVWLAFLGATIAGFFIFFRALRM